MNFGEIKKLEIVLAMDNPFDLEEYIRRNHEAEMFVIGLETEFAQKVGVIMYVKNKYPNLHPHEAYINFFKGNHESDMSGDKMVNTQVVGGDNVRGDHPMADCNGCGGGQIR